MILKGNSEGLSNELGKCFDRIETFLHDWYAAYLVVSTHRHTHIYLFSVWVLSEYTNIYV